MTDHPFSTFKNKAPPSFDEKLLSLDSKYPVYGTFLQKYNFVSEKISNLENFLSKKELSRLKEEEEYLLQNARAESPTALGRFIQYIFNLPPYRR